MKRVMSILVLIGVITAVTLLPSGCCPLLQSSSDGGSESGGIGGTEAPTLDAFLDASKKTGEFTLSSVYSDGSTLEQSGEFWVDGRMFRLDLYQDGELIRSIMSPDGITAYFAQHDEKVCEPSVASVDFYLMEFGRPDATGTDDGIDEETGAQRVTYSIKKIEDLPGAMNPWYLEDITYLVEDGAVIGIVKRGTVPEDDGTIGDLDMFRRMFSNVRVGASIPADTFELPYPIKEAQ